jgi:hypothetical protein
VAIKTICVSINQWPYELFDITPTQRSLTPDNSDITCSICKDHRSISMIRIEAFEYLASILTPARGFPDHSQRWKVKFWLLLSMYCMWGGADQDNGLHYCLPRVCMRPLNTAHPGYMGQGQTKTWSPLHHCPPSVCGSNWVGNPEPAISPPKWIKPEAFLEC